MPDIPRKLFAGGNTVVIANLIAYILVLVGALNWGMYGIFNFNLVSAIFMEPRTNGALKLQGDREVKDTKKA